MEKDDITPRRDFIFLATGAFAAMGGVALAKPIFGHMKPAADHIDRHDFLIDLAPLEEGQQMKFLYQNKPYAVRHRTAAEIESARRDDKANLPDPETDQSRLRPKADGSYDPRFLVFSLVCSHFGCVVVGEAGAFDGWYCPCHSGHFDTSGRVRKGPPPRNLDIPPYEWVSDTVISLRANGPLQLYEASQL